MRGRWDVSFSYRGKGAAKMSKAPQEISSLWRGGSPHSFLPPTHRAARMNCPSIGTLLVYGLATLVNLYTLDGQATQPVRADTSNVLWQPEQQISFGTTDACGPPVFATGDTIHIFWAGPNSATCYYVRSTDGGTSFSSLEHQFESGWGHTTHSLVSQPANSLLPVGGVPCRICGACGKQWSVPSSESSRDTGAGTLPFD